MNADYFKLDSVEKLVNDRFPLTYRIYWRLNHDYLIAHEDIKGADPSDAMFNFIQVAKEFFGLMPEDFQICGFELLE